VRHVFNVFALHTAGALEAEFMIINHLMRRWTSVEQNIRIFVLFLLGIRESFLIHAAYTTQAELE